MSPSSCMAAICPVMPPRAKRQRMFLSSIICRRNRAAAREAPPEPICMEKPSYRYPAASMTWAAVWAMSSSLGFLVYRVAPDMMPLGSPMSSVTTM